MSSWHPPIREKPRGDTCRHGLRIGEDAFDDRESLTHLRPELEDEVEDLDGPPRTGKNVGRKGGKLLGAGKTDSGGKHFDIVALGCASQAL